MQQKGCAICNNTNRFMTDGGMYCVKCSTEEEESIERSYKNGVLEPEIDKITDNIFLGNYDGARDLEKLKTNGITHILVCASHLKKMYPEDFEYLQFELEDNDQDITQYFLEAIKFIDQANIVYVHCMAGVSRSSTMVIAYSMWKNKLSYDEAYWAIKKCRRCICPNYKFEEQLRNWHKYLIEKNYEIIEK